MDFADFFVKAAKLISPVLHQDSKIDRVLPDQFFFNDYIFIMFGLGTFCIKLIQNSKNKFSWISLLKYVLVFKTVTENLLLEIFKLWTRKVNCSLFTKIVLNLLTFLFIFSRPFAFVKVISKPANCLLKTF